MPVKWTNILYLNLLSIIGEYKVNNCIVTSICLSLVYPSLPAMMSYSKSHVFSLLFRFNKQNVKRNQQQQTGLLLLMIIVKKSTRTRINIYCLDCIITTKQNT